MKEFNEKCHCGKPLHYTSERLKNFVDDVIKIHGDYVRVTCSKGVTYLVKRHYIALHGLEEQELYKLGFEKL
jgi:hypothetical protein